MFDFAETKRSVGRSGSAGVQRHSQNLRFVKNLGKSSKNAGTEVGTFFNNNNEITLFVTGCIKNV